MKTVMVWCCILLAMVLVFPATDSFAAGKHYLLANNDAIPGNSITLFELNDSNGSLKEVRSVATNGTGLGGGYSAIPLLSINGSDRCMFASNSSAFFDNGFVGDISAFTVPSLTLVGNYGDISLNGFANGIGLAVNPSGQYLYAGYTQSNNIAVWKVNADCSLSLTNTYSVAGAPAGMGVGQQGGFQFLAVTFPDSNLIDVFSIGDGGASLAEQPAGPVRSAAPPSGLDITRDGNVIVVGDIADPAQVETWWVSNDAATCSPLQAPCLTGHQDFRMLGPANNAATLWLSPAAWSDPAIGGCIYIANTNTFTVTPGHFQEGSAPGNVVLTKLAPVRIRAGQDVTFLGQIQTMTTTGAGGGIYLAEYPDFIETMKASSDCSLATGTVAQVPGLGPAVLSIAAWPPR